MLKELRPAIVLLLAFTVLTGLFYPLVITAVASIVFPYQSHGSLIEKDGKVVGSALIGQAFTSDHFFRGRPSATVGPDPADPSKTIPAPYNGANSGGSNLGPTSKVLIARVAADVEKLRQEDPSDRIPIDLVTTSASGLDPDITPEAAYFQVPRIAKARDMTENAVRQLVAENVQGRSLGVFGEPRVNVLALNLALDGVGRQ
jgi:potassium-transporting ATPase KdpC subunit